MQLNGEPMVILWLDEIRSHHLETIYRESNHSRVSWVVRCMDFATNHPQYAMGGGGPKTKTPTPRAMRTRLAVRAGHVPLDSAGGSEAAEGARVSPVHGGPAFPAALKQSCLPFDSGSESRRDPGDFQVHPLRDPAKLGVFVGFLCSLTPGILCVPFGSGWQIIACCIVFVLLWGGVGDPLKK